MHPTTPLQQTAPKLGSSRRQHLHHHLPQRQLLAAAAVLVRRVTLALRGAPRHRHHLQRGRGQDQQQQTAPRSQVGCVAA